MPCLLVIMMSLYIFPVTFTFFPMANSKMVMAFVGLIILFFGAVSKRSIHMWKDVIVMVALSIFISLIGMASMSMNNTNDNSYATYFVSMTVWLVAAYVVCISIYKTHGFVSTKLVCLYFIAVCICQCIIALGVEFNNDFKVFVDALAIQDQAALTKGNRMYGFGASLDTAGIRFSISLIMIVYLACTDESSASTGSTVFYVIAFSLISVVGNMVARTTLVGVIVSLVLLLFLKRNTWMLFNFRVVLIALTLFTLSSIWVIYLYNNNEEVYDLIRFGFEPFFNYFGGGDFATSSNEMLRHMYVFPDNFKTWIIGDGYFNNPNTHDPYYVGQSSVQGFYMGTDVGYLRLIFYFGLIGLLTFMIFLIHVTQSCCRHIPEDKILFVSILVLGFIIWLKVATDLFFVMALFICRANMSHRDDEKKIES